MLNVLAWYDPILVALGTALSTLVIYLINRLVTYLNKKIKNDKINQILYRAESVINSCVIATNQTFVDTLKKDGKFDLENQKKAFEEALNNSKKLITNETKDIINTYYGDFESWLRTQIEVAVKLNK